MKTHKLILPLLALVLIAIACQLTNAVTPTPVPAVAVQIFPTDTSLPGVPSAPAEGLATATLVAPTVVAPTTVVQLTATTVPIAITPEMLLNRDYQLPNSGKTVTLKDGKYEGGQGADYLMAAVSKEMAFGDFNGDGLQDAAVVLFENMGGSGMFESLVVFLNGIGGLVQGPSTPLGDRVGVKAVGVAGDRIVLDLVTSGPNDPLCCPTQPQKQTFTLTSGVLLLARVTSQTPDQQERSIQITAPKDQEAVGSPASLSGNVTITPFENTLAYRILDVTGKELKAGSFIIDGATAGNPANFATSIPLEGLASGTRFWLQVLDLSLANGSVMALDSVELVAK